MESAIKQNTKDIHEVRLELVKVNSTVSENCRQIKELKQVDMAVLEESEDHSRILHGLDQKINKNGLTDAIKGNAKDIKEVRKEIANMSKKYWLLLVILAFIAGDVAVKYLGLLI